MAKGTNIPPFIEEGLSSFKQFKFPGVDMETLLSSHQRNMELIATTQQIAAESTKSIMELQNEYLKKVFDQWNEQVKCCCSKAPMEEKTTDQAKAAKAVVNEAVEHTQEFNSIIAKSIEKIGQSVQKRMKEGLEESVNLVKKSRNK